MSSFWAGYHGTALVLEEEDREYFLKKCCEKFSDIDDIDDMAIQFEQCTALVDGKPLLTWKDGEAVNVAVISPDFCDGMRLYPYLGSEKGFEIPKSCFLLGKDLIVIYAEHQLDSYESLCARPYDGYEDLKQRYIDLLKDYLPDNFNWDCYIGSFSYAVYA